MDKRLACLSCLKWGDATGDEHNQLETRRVLVFGEVSKFGPPDSVLQPALTCTVRGTAGEWGARAQDSSGLGSRARVERYYPPVRCAGQLRPGKAPTHPGKQDLGPQPHAPSGISIGPQAGLESGRHTLMLLKCRGLDLGTGKARLQMQVCSCKPGVGAALAGVSHHRPHFLLGPAHQTQPRPGLKGPVSLGPRLYQATSGLPDVVDLGC
ncbi:hypothetical protein NDU88_005510 [Pleurodeles waltl]|uniref:Uncharacterized protein n=1 Tax=Pleurodeles waltl TaxID=8319 RepID=A0AAV7RPF1_PLEWA|nr:hypothetical protein NDU88_005510 [Pleurodeles waltl]